MPRVVGAAVMVPVPAVPVPAAEYGLELVPLADGSALVVAAAEMEPLPEGPMVVALDEIEGSPERLKLYAGAVPDGGGTVVALAEMEKLADGSSEADVPMVPTIELAEL